MYLGSDIPHINSLKEINWDLVELCYNLINDPSIYKKKQLKVKVM